MRPSLPLKDKDSAGRRRRRTKDKNAEGKQAAHGEKGAGTTPDDKDAEKSAKGQNRGGGEREGVRIRRAGLSRRAEDRLGTPRSMVEGEAGQGVPRRRGTPGLPKARGDAPEGRAGLASEIPASSSVEPESEAERGPASGIDGPGQQPAPAPGPLGRAGEGVRPAGRRRAGGEAQDLFGTLRQLGPTPDPQGEAAQKKAIGEIMKAAKDKPNPPLELALALVTAAENERLDTGAIKLLDGLVAEGGFGLEILELRIVRDLAKRAASPGAQPWPEETVKLAWITNVLGEMACNRPAALPWVRKLLEQAETSLHEARVLLQSEARDYVTWTQIGEAWQKARQDLDFVATCQDKIEDAETTMDRARAILPAYLPFLYATRLPGFDTTWLAAANATVALDRQMKRPLEGDGEAASAATREQMEQLNNDLTAATGEVRFPLEQLERPFLHDAVRELIRQSEAARPDPQVAVEIEAILVTPFPAAADREALWRAGTALDRRLAAFPLAPTRELPRGRRFRTGRARSRPGGSPRQATGRPAESHRGGCHRQEPGGRRQAERRGRRLESSFRGRVQVGDAPLVQTWGGLARVARLVHVKLTQIPISPAAETVRIGPAGSPRPSC